MQNQNIHKKLIERILKKISQQILEPNVKLTPLSSFANNVYKVQVDEDENKQLSHKTFLLKIFRQNLAEFTNKLVQNQVVTQLSKHGQYPQVFYADQNYRIEEFVHGYAPTRENITQAQLLNIMDRLTDLVKIFRCYAQKKDKKFQNQRQINDMFEMFLKVVEQCKQKLPQSYEICKQYVQPIFQPSIINKLKEIVPKEMVATHNDCHFNNVIISNKDHKLYLIDYQFFCPNYRGFELGNFFNQFAIDYFTCQIKEQLEFPENVKDLLIQRYYSRLNSEISHEQAKREVKIGRLLSHLYWLFIGVKQVKDTKMEIDMQKYIRRRYEQFIKILCQFE